MLKTLSKLAIISVVILTGLSFIPLSDSKFNFDLEQFFPVDDPDLAFFHEYTQRFNSNQDNEYIYVGLTNEKGIFEKEFLLKVDSLTQYIYSMDSIVAVYSVTNSYYNEVERGKFIQTPIIHFHHPEHYEADSIRLFGSNEFKEFMISKDGKSIAISAFNTLFLSDYEKALLLENIQNKIEILDFDKSYFTAKILVEATYLEEIKNNLTLYLSISLVLICITLWLLFRSFKTIIIPLITIVFSMSWTFGLMAYFGYPVDVISSLLPPVLAVICMSDIIHLYTKYIEELRLGVPKIEALKKTFKEIGFATFFTSITTAIGFFALSISDIIPIRVFGIFAGIGVLLSFVIVLVLILGSSVISKEPKVAQFQENQKTWILYLATALQGIIRFRFTVIWISLAVIVGSVYFINKIELNSSLLQEIPNDNPILEDYNFIETQFSGTRSFEMALLLKDSNDTFLDVAIINEIDSISNFLEDSCGVGLLVSHVSFLKTARQAYDGGTSKAFRVPENETEVYFLSNKIMSSPWAGEFVRFMTLDRSYSRISGKLPDLTTKEFSALSQKFDEFFQKMNPQYLEYKMTGPAVLIDKSTFSLPYNMVVGLFIVFTIISLIVGVMFKSVKMIFIVMLSNGIPLVIMAAIMGALDIFLKADTSIIFAVALGIVVDDSIHFLSRFKIELAKGSSIMYAIKRAYLSTGKAMVITTILLLTGFIPLLLSSFGGAYYIGLLVSVCLVFAVIIDLTLLPVLVMLFYRKKS